MASPAVSSHRVVSASAVLSADAINHAPDAADLSSGVFPGRPVDLHGIRRRLPERWAAFLQSHFHGPAHIAAFFSVDERTARDWLSGRHGVNSAPVIFAMRLIPGAVAELLEAA
jgi:hypothetical protein